MKQYSIVGQKHCGLDPYLAGILPGVSVTLIREPKNKFDPNAVMVWIDGKHVGYIPSRDAAALAPFIDQTGTPWQEPVKMAADGVTGQIVSHPRTISAVFVRSRNSSYPQVKVE
jgi:hypothetical protein